MRPPITLTIAGSDSGGGAGIQADLKTFAAFGCFGTSAIVAITVQNTLGVRAVHTVPGEIVKGQIDALAEDLPPAALKTGMLASRELTLLVANSIRERRWSNCVIDPVMVSSTGDRLLDDDAIEAVSRHLLPLATCITPNLDEAEILVGFSVRDPEAMERAGKRLVEMGAESALIKGGHLSGSELVDVLVTRQGTISFASPRIISRASHGTGCTLSAAITASLALAAPLEVAVQRARSYLRAAIAQAPDIGAGNGPLWHGASWSGQS